MPIPTGDWKISQILLKQTSENKKETIMSTFLSERPNKRYIIVAERHNDTIDLPVIESHTVEAPTIPEAILTLLV